MQIDISVDSHAKNLHKIHKTQTREEERKKIKSSFTVYSKFWCYNHSISLYLFSVSLTNTDTHTILRRIGHSVLKFCSIRFGSIERWWITVICCRYNKIQSDEFINESERNTGDRCIGSKIKFISINRFFFNFDHLFALYIQCILVYKNVIVYSK